MSSAKHSIVSSTPGSSLNARPTKRNKQSSGFIREKAPKRISTPAAPVLKSSTRHLEQTPSGLLGVKKLSEYTPIALPQTAVNADDGDPQWLDETFRDVSGELPPESVSERKVPKATRIRRKMVYRTAMQRFMKSQRAVYLDELIRHEGRRHSDGALCPRCPSSDTAGPIMYRCTTCTQSPELCRQCVVKMHWHHPFCHIQMWTGHFWQKVELIDIDDDLKLQLGHDGGRCPAPENEPRKLNVVHSNGIHHLRVRYCACQPLERWAQLMRAKLYPSSEIKPRSCWTFDFLDTYVKVSLQGKLALYDFYLSILHKSHNAATSDKLHALWNPLSLVSRQYIHLKMLKRAVRSHDPIGALVTPRGSLALLCPACPQPGKNLPEGWEDTAANRQWIYRTRLSADGCFKLKQRERGIDDVDMDTGGAYFVEDSRYQEFERAASKEKPEDCTCASTHRAISQALTKGSDGYRVTGVIAVKCARHACVLPNGVANLSKGEKFRDTDYVILASMSCIGVSPQWIDLIYDIVCEFWKNFRTRIDGYPQDLVPPWFLDAAWRYFIPKFHIPAHGLKCQTRYSLNWNRGCGRTFGEMIEQEWAHIKKCAPMTREQGPFARQLTLDHQWGGWNWRVTVRLGDLLGRQLRIAVHWAAKMGAIAREHDEGVKPETLATWKGDVEAWHHDHSYKPDPYEEPVLGKDYARLQANWAAEDLQDPSPTLHKLSPSEFIKRGLDLEDRVRAAQLLVKSRSNKNHESTDHQILEQRQKAVALKRDINAWIEVRTVYISAAKVLDDEEATNRETSGVIQPWEVKLWLPSSLPADLRLSGCAVGLVEKEMRARIAMATTSLSQIRTGLRVRDNAVRTMRTQAFGTGEKIMTRARARVAGTQNRIDRAAATYRASYDALLLIDPRQNGFELLRTLLDSDISGPTREADEVILAQRGQLADGLASRGKYTQTWIWRVYGATQLRVGEGLTQQAEAEAELEIFHAQLRTAWAKAQARYERWEEEIVLLLEEMRRTLAFMDWKARCWRGQATARCNEKVSDGKAMDPVLVSGLDAYAEEQADIYESIARAFAVKWAPLLFQQELVSEWLTRWLPDKYTAPPLPRSRAKVPLTAPVVARSVPQPTPSSILIPPSAFANSKSASMQSNPLDEASPPKETDDFDVESELDVRESDYESIDEEDGSMDDAELDAFE